MPITDDLLRQVRKLKSELAERLDPWLRAQLDALAVDVDRPSAPQTSEQWRRCLQGMLRGEDWQHGTWR